MAECPDDDTAAAIARATAVRAAVSVGVELGVLLAVMWVGSHREGIARRWQSLLALAARPTGLPADAGLRLGDFNRTVSAWDHGERS